ncbi:MAG: LPP20 family lipoprotein [Treponema sp.]|jgi:hypothetical protein|nr:LPP20 family lipoprotein [Treponema sp.]
MAYLKGILGALQGGFMKAMNKTEPVFLSLAFAVLVSACTSVPKAASVPNPLIPDFVSKPPVQEDSIFGIGSAKLSSINQALLLAEERARQSLAFQLHANVQAMITDYTRSAKREHAPASLEFAEAIGRQVSRMTLKGAVPVRRQKTPDGTFWVLISYSKADAAKTLAGIIEHEASLYAEFKALDALKMMDQQLLHIRTKPEVVNQ